MAEDIPAKGLQFRSLLKENGELELSLAEVETPQPGPGEVLIRVEAAPINPSDLGLMVGGADVAAGKAVGDTFVAPTPPAFVRAMAARIGHSLPAGNEGAGVVVKAGEGAETLVGKTVALFGGAMYSQFRTARAQDLLVLPEGADAKDGAACFVNPLTALAMVSAMRLENHTGLVHKAAASNLGQMLVKICLADRVPLVNIVRSPAQVKLLKDLGAEHVVDSSAPSFMEDLVQALMATKATLAFDAIGGGKIVGQILSAMEQAANRGGASQNRYGSDVFKQVYIYGGLDPSPTELTRAFGFTWAIGGFLLMPHLQRVGPVEAEAMRQRVARELKTTFASHYTQEISLAEMLKPEVIAAYNKKATGEKYLVRPQA